MTSAADAKNSAIDLPIFIPKGDQKQSRMPFDKASFLTGF
jgi:hypothetical protein